MTKEYDAELRQGFEEIKDMLRDFIWAIVNKSEMPIVDTSLDEYGLLTHDGKNWRKGEKPIEVYRRLLSEGKSKEAGLWFGQWFN